MSFHFGKGSLRNREGAHPDLIRLSDWVIERSSHDLTILGGGGLRTLAQAQENVARGTGILNSLHRKQSDGYGHALDLVLYKNGRATWDQKYASAYRETADLVGRGSAYLSIPIRQGCDWNMNGVFGESREWDWPHVEIPEFVNLPKAIALMKSRRRSFGLCDDCEFNCPKCGTTLRVDS